MLVGRPSDVEASNFIGTGQEPTGYAVTDDAATPHAALANEQVREESGLVERPRILAELAYSLPSRSGISRQFGLARAHTSNGTTNHEHAHAGGHDE